MHKGSTKCFGVWAATQERVHKVKVSGNIWQTVKASDHPTRTQLESNKSGRIGKMLATITKPFGPSA